ncbi:MAG: hypothetical protein Q7U59_10555 [Lutibacter sp.]|nr:hypothetical protein [Lutibacter sp.]
MKKQLLILSLAITFVSCGGVKKTQEAINFGNYDQAIETAVKNLRNNKTKKSNQPYVFMLEDAFAKATERDLNKIKFLKNEGNPANLENIYTIYANLDYRQELIKPLLPLPILNKNRNAKFQFKDYANDIINSKEKLSNYLYGNAKKLLIYAENKIDFRNIYNDLAYLDKINPNYKDTKALLEEAHYKGTDFVYVFMQNQTDKIIPIRLEDDLLNFDTYKLNNLWTVYHNKKQPQLNYDFEIALNLREINISPEQIREKQIVQEKQVKDGWKYLLDHKGNAIKDSLGNNIKVDKFKTIRSTLYQNTQNKSVQIIGQMNYIDLKNNQLIKSFPLESGFKFEHNYATYSGDKNALDTNYLDLLRNVYITFPSNEQMIYDCGEDLKQKIKHIISTNNLR